MTNGKSEIDRSLIETLKNKRNAESADIIALITIIQEFLGHEKPNRKPTFIYLMEAFDLKLPDVLRLSGWEGFGDDGTWTDIEIISRFENLMSKKQRN